MTKSQLIETVASKLENVSKKDIEIIVETIFSCMTDALTRDERIEIRGFGSFVSKIRDAREGRNPKTGEKVSEEAHPFLHGRQGVEGTGEHQETPESHHRLMPLRLLGA